MGYQYLRHGTVSDAVLNLVADTLAVGGLDGKHYRAIIARGILFLRQIAPLWVEVNRDRLFGSAAPGDLGQVTIELALAHGRPDAWVLQHLRAKVQAATGRADERRP